MTTDKVSLYRVFGEIDADLIKEAEPVAMLYPEEGSRVRRGWISFLRSGWFTAAACLVLTFVVYAAVVLGSGGSLLHPFGGSPVIIDPSGTHGAGPAPITPADSGESTNKTPSETRPETEPETESAGEPESGTQCPHENMISRVEREASCFCPGELKLVCAECGFTETRLTDQTGHTYRGGFCKDCGLDERVDLSLWTYDENTGLRYTGGDTPVELVVFPNVWVLPSIISKEGELLECALMDTYCVPVGCFKGATGVRGVELPRTLLEIQEEAFEGCTSLQYVKLPEELQAIGNSAFYGCSSLREVDFPETIEWIGIEAFAGTTSLERICFAPSGKEVVICESAFEGNGAVEMRPPDYVTVSGGGDGEIPLAGANLKRMLVDEGNLSVAAAWLPSENGRRWFPVLEELVVDMMCQELDGELVPPFGDRLYRVLDEGYLRAECRDGRYDPKAFPQR